MSNMYDNAKTWNPFKGCEFNCSYCKPSFQAQAKRQKHNCMLCYEYKPHCHPDRIKRIPKAEIVFACGNGDVAFCPAIYLRKMLHAAGQRPDQTFYFQSKRPSVFRPYTIPDNVILVTTLETNINAGYGYLVSKTAPPPHERYMQFLELIHPRKVVTIEPIMEFDELTFTSQIIRLNPEYVWIGYNSRRASIKLPEPSMEKTLRLIESLKDVGISVKVKNMNISA